MEPVVDLMGELERSLLRAQRCLMCGTRPTHETETECGHKACDCGGHIDCTDCEVER